MIELDEFEYPATDYFRYLLWYYMKVSFWLLAYAAVGIFPVNLYWTLVDGEWDAFVLVFYFSLVASTLLFLLLCALHISRSKENRHVWKRRKITFDDQMMNVVCEDGSESHSLWNHIIKARIIGKYFILFLSQQVFYPIPLSAFRSDEDRKKFETEILGPKLLKNRFPWLWLVVFVLVAAAAFGMSYHWGTQAAERYRIELAEPERQS